jgi:hypothetical protein
MQQKVTLANAREGYLLKRRCMIGTYIGTIGKDPFNLFLSAVQLALGCTTGMRQWQ